MSYDIKGVSRDTGRFRRFYAQNREDLIIKAFLPDIKDGFYVDVGANHPELHSVTKLFYDDGWRGINIEPQEKGFKLLSKARPRDINLMVAAGSRNSTLELTIYPEGDGLSTLAPHMVSLYREKGGAHTKKVKAIDVEVLMLRDILDKNLPDGIKIDFLKIDVEGFEGEVISGNDWNKYRPRLICIEANHTKEDWSKSLAIVNYQEVFFDGLNKYFLAKEETSRLEVFKSSSFLEHATAELSIYNLAANYVATKSAELATKSVEDALLPKISMISSELDSLKNSRSYKLGHMLLSPLRVLKVALSKSR